MQILVCIKQILDPKTVRVSRSRQALDTRKAEPMVNPPDKHALEAALRLKERTDARVTAVSLGPPEADDALREALAIGADQAYLLSDELLLAADAHGVAVAIAAAARQLGDVRLLLTGARALDTGSGTLAALIAESLGWPMILNGFGLQLVEDRLQAYQQLDGQGYLASVSLPAVVSVAPTVERPRYPHGARIMNAYRTMQVTTWTSQDLGLSAETLAPRTELRELQLPPERELGVIVEGTPEEAARTLVQHLRDRRLL
ncbi:MAG TPA: electron transfer flavoprotein subunit beta/FixA family protein [Anaerolineae bacterium]|nr:electron transfer flavoprotein subunit beta/FixA family protein [Anaerolineae bacterium]